MRKPFSPSPQTIGPSRWSSFFLACFWKGRTTGVEQQIKNKLRGFYRFDSRFLVLSMLAKKNGMLWHSVELSRRSSYWFQLRFLRRTFKIPRACSKVHIVVWRVVNKVILQNSFGSSETSSRHLAELKANIDVVLGKWGLLHHFFFSSPSCEEYLFHIIWLKFGPISWCFKFHRCYIAQLPCNKHEHESIPRDAEPNCHKLKYFCWLYTAVVSIRDQFVCHLVPKTSTALGGGGGRGNKRTKRDHKNLRGASFSVVGLVCGLWQYEAKR